MTASWRLKLYRAEEHLAHLKESLPHGMDRGPHDVVERFDPDEQGGVWSYILDLEYEVDESIPPKIGEFLFNTRSALDHLAAACVAPDEKNKVQFPIFWEDPIRTDPATGGHVNPKAWAAWKGRTKPFPPAILPTIVDLQPFEQARKYSKPATEHALSALAMLQDTDKHQQLVVAPSTLFKIAVTVDGVSDYLVPGMHNGELILTSPVRLDVRIEGALQIGIGVSLRTTWEFPYIFDEMLDCVANDVLPPIESFLGV